MKRSGFKNKPRKPLKRSTLRIKGISSTTEKKQEIQDILREIVIIRDKKCILYGIRCNHEVGMEGIVWQAEHLIERSNSATFADLRMVVLVCKNCHGWKHFTKSNHDQYDEWVRSKFTKERNAHWERCKKESWRGSKVDWALELVALKQELKKLQKE